MKMMAGFTSIRTVKPVFFTEKSGFNFVSGLYVSYAHQAGFRGRFAGSFFKEQPE